MRPLHPLISVLTAALVLAGSATAAPPPPAPASHPQTPPVRHAAGAFAPALTGKAITVNAASVEVNYKTHSVLYRKVVISQGKVVVRADRARTTMGKDRRNSQWTLQGDVQIQAPPRGSLDADRAVVNVLGSRITRAIVSGNPAQFRQQSRGSGKITQGHANQIVYDVTQGTVRLIDDAWLSDGRNQISGSLVTYNVLKDRIEAGSPGGAGRVHITITPQTAPSGKEALQRKARRLRRKPTRSREGP